MIFKQVASRLGFTTLDWNFKLLEESWKVQQKLLKTVLCVTCGPDSALLVRGFF